MSEFFHSEKTLPLAVRMMFTVSMMLGMGYSPIRRTENSMAGDALIDALVLRTVKGVVPSGKDVGGAEGGHQFMDEEVGFEKLLDDEELGVEVLVTLPNVVKVAELANDVERGEHGGGEVVIKARACQSRSCWSVSCLGTEPTRLEWSTNFIIMLSLYIKK